MEMGFNPRLFTGVIFLLLSYSSSLYAESGIIHHFSGFATIGVVSNDNPNLIFRRDVTQGFGSNDGDPDWRNDSSLGLQWQTEWSYQLQTTFQFVAKDRFENSLSNALEWGFIRYRPIDGLDIRLGRMGTDIFMLADYRQVGYAFPWVRPPHDTYGLLSFYNFDGIDVNKRFDTETGVINIKAFYGKSNQKYPIGLNDADAIHFIFDGGGVSVNWELDNWKLRYSVAKIEIENNNNSTLLDALQAAGPIWPEAYLLADGIHTKSKQFKYNEFAITYDNNTWWAQAEATKLDSDSLVVQSTRHFYISVGRRIDQFTLYGIRGFVRSASDPVHLVPPGGYPPAIAQQLAALAYGTELTINGSRSNQHSVGVGVRWDFTSKMALKFEAEKFKIDKYGSAIWIKVDPLSPPQNETANLLSLSLDMLF